MTKSNTRRAVPSIREFYALKKATLTYTTLLLNSSLNMETQERYVDTSLINQTRLAKEVGVGRGTYYNHLKKLEEAGFTRQEDNLIILTKESKYALIEKETLSYLLNTGNTHVVSIFAELTWRWKLYSTKTYFTQNLLLEELGLTNQGKNHAVIRDVLDVLQKQGLIELMKHKTEKGNVVMRLTNLEKRVSYVEIEEVEDIITEKDIRSQWGGFSSSSF